MHSAGLESSGLSGGVAALGGKASKAAPAGVAVEAVVLLFGSDPAKKEIAGPATFTQSGCTASSKDLPDSDPTDKKSESTAAPAAAGAAAAEQAMLSIDGQT